MKGFATILLSVLIGLAQCLSSTDTITWGGDNTRAGYFTTHNMDPAVVGSSQFGQVFKTQLPGTYVGSPEQVFSQPLVYTTPSDGKQYVYWATTQNNVYKMDAKTGEIVAKRNLHIPFLAADLDGCVDINPCIGVTATGVIDPDTDTWYLTSKTYLDQTAGPVAQGRSAGRYYVHAINVNDLTERDNFPVNLEGLIANNNPERMFTGGIHHQRPGLLHTGQFIYAGFASHCVQYNFTGWIIGVDKTSGKIVEKWATEGEGVPNTVKGGGIWMSGGGLASDDAGSMFFGTGNGYASQLSTIPVNGFNPPTSMEEAACHMTINSDGSLSLIDFFMPWEKPALDGGDKDLGTSPLELLPSQFSCGDVKRMGVITGKSGKTYWLNLDNLGGYRNGADQKDKVIQVYQNENSVYAGAGVYPLEGGYIYINVIQYPSHVFKFSCTNNVPSFTKVADTPVSNAYILGVSHGTVTSLNGKEGTGLLWITDVQNTNFHIYNAVPKDGTMTLVNSFTITGITKFTRPVFGDGMVYIGTTLGYVYGYGSTNKSPINCSSPIDFGNVDITDTSAVQTVTCKALSDVSISGIKLADSTNYAIYNVPTVPLTVTKGNTFTFKAKFTPQSVGRLGGTVVVNTTTADTTYSTSSNILLTGVGKSANALLDVSPKTVTFSGIIAGQAADAETVLLTNNGVADLTVTSVEYSTDSATGPFQTWSGSGALTVGKFSLTSIPNTVTGGQSTAVSINFDSTDIGNYLGYVKFNSNGGSGVVTLNGTAGAAPVAYLEFQTPDATGWVPYVSGTNFTFGNVTENTSRSLKFRVTNKAPTGGVSLSLTVSKPPFGVSGIVRAVNQVDLAEGTLLAPGESSYAVLTCTVPKSQWNVDPYNGTAQWTMNTNDPTFDKQFIGFYCGAVSEQAPPLLTNGQGKYRYIGCFLENNPGRQLPNELYADDSSTNAKCIQSCSNNNYVFCGTQYHRECWAGNTIPKLRVDDSNCNYDCSGDLNEICGGNGVGTGAGSAYLSVFADGTRWDGSYTSSSASTGPFVNPGTLGYTSIGCYTEGTSSRALPNGKTNSNNNVAGCIQACKASSYTYAGVEYGGECWCGNSFSTGSIPTAIGDCNMVCNGNSTEYCGGSNRLNVYQFGASTSSTSSSSSSTSTTQTSTSTSISQSSQTSTSTVSSSSSSTSSTQSTSITSAPSTSTTTTTKTTTTTTSTTSTQTGPVVQPTIGTWSFQGCWTEGNGIRALNQKTYAQDDMTLESCAAFCVGYDYFGAEYGRECYCGNTLNTGSVKADNQNDCYFPCVGSKFEYCGAGNRLQLYKKGGSSSTSSTISSTTTSTTSTSTSSTFSTSTTSSTTSKPTTSSTTTSSTTSSSTTTSTSSTSTGSTSSTTSTTTKPTSTTTSTTSTSTTSTSSSSITTTTSHSTTTSSSTSSTISPTPSVWPGNKNFTYYSCVSEPSSGRLLANQPLNDGTQMTIELCLETCKNYIWVGVEYGRECWCANSLNLKGNTGATPGKNVTNADCNFRCPGNNLLWCGGSSRMNLYLNNVTKTPPTIIQ